MSKRTNKREDFIPPNEGAENALVIIEEQLEQARRLLHARAREIGNRFVERRTNETDGTFCPLNLLVRRRGDSIQCAWVLYHFKNGVRSGTSTIRKTYGATAYDLASIKARAPDWLQPAAVEAEEALRPVREGLAQLVRIKKALAIVSDRNHEFVPLQFAAGSDVREETDPDDPLDPNND